MQAHQAVIDKLVTPTQVTTVLNGMSTRQEGDFPGMLTIGGIVNRLLGENRLVIDVSQI